MSLRRLISYELVSDLKFSKFAMWLNYGGALIVLVLGFRFIGEVATTPLEQLMALMILLLLCLALIGLGMLTHLYELVKDRKRAAEAE